MQWVWCLADVKNSGWGKTFITCASAETWVELIAHAPTQAPVFGLKIVCNHGHRWFQKRHCLPFSSALYCFPNPKIFVLYEGGKEESWRSLLYFDTLSVTKFRTFKKQGKEGASNRFIVAGDLPQIRIRLEGTSWRREFCMVIYKLFYFSSYHFLETRRT